MSLFVGIAVVMVAAALAWILVPLLRGTTGVGVTGEASNVAVLRDQLHELETDLRNGTISRESYDLARQDLERRALEESKNPARTVTSMPSRAGALTAALVAGALPIAAVLIYVALGNFDAFSGGATAGRHDVSPEQIAKMIKELEGRLEKDPGNAEGWSILARTYYQLNRFPEATRAYEHAAALNPNDAQLLADYADALAAAQGGTLQGKPLELVTRALAADPTQWKALALAGTEAFDRKDYAQAVVYWERMKASVPPGSQIAQSVDASIAEARELGGLKAAALPAPPAMAKGPPAAAASTPAKAPVAGSSDGSVAGTVTLAPALAASVSPNDVVFIFARAVQGPRMPLAIMKKQVRDLPIAFTLDDSMSMSPTTTLSSAGEVIVGARVSRSGQAIPQSGDVEGFSPPVRVGARGVAVVIEKAIP
jgi:cytochrome c-type biogenesis protein CcmH